MLHLRSKYHTTHLSTRSMAKDVFQWIHQQSASEQVLDFEGIEFASRSFMVQLYSMMAESKSQVRLVNMISDVEEMYRLAVHAYNKPTVMPSLMNPQASPETLVFG